MDKENLNFNGRRRLKKAKKKVGSLEEDIELYNDEIICEKMGKMFKRNQSIKKVNTEQDQVHSISNLYQRSQEGPESKLVPKF